MNRNELVAAALVCLAVSALVTSAPETCVCKLSKTVAFCNSKNLTEIPACVPGDTKKLYLLNTSVRLNRTSLARFPDLEMLRLFKVSSDDLSPDFLAGVPSLKQLHIAGRNVAVIPSHIFYYVPELQNLTVFATRLSSIPAEQFEHAPNLEEIHLDKNKINFADVMAFARMYNLQRLKLAGNPWLCDCELQAFGLWLLTSRVKLLDEPKCLNPREHRGKPLLRVLPSINCSAYFDDQHDES